MTSTDDTPAPTPQLHVVLGAGQVGSRLSDLLLARGHHVRVVRRSGSVGKLPPRLEHARGDMSQLAFAEGATLGATVVYDCMNPPYHQWPQHLIGLGRGALHGASKAGAKLVALDSVYMYGRPTGPLTEQSPVNPCSKKGALRAELAELRLAAHARGDVRVAIGRASDFFGANLQQSYWNDRFFQRLFAGRPGETCGDPDMPHSYTYVEDVTRALAVLGESTQADGRVWHLPTPPAESTRRITERLGRALSLDAEVQGMPKLMLRALGLFSPLMRELVEMTYQWEMPFVLDDTQYRSTFGGRPTSTEEAVALTAAWASARFGPRSRGARAAESLRSASRADDEIGNQAGR